MNEGQILLLIFAGLALVALGIWLGFVVADDSYEIRKQRRIDRDCEKHWRAAVDKFRRK